ncbi:MAG: hypothetical protein K2K02_10290 [Ruminococcus sp.]|nr:hypothetical protein [Ruminococcus sp.]
MVNLDKSNKDSIYVEKNHLIVTITSIGLTGIILAVVFALTDNTETGRNTVTDSVTDSSVICTVEDVGTVQNVDTKPDNSIIVDSDGKSSVVYGGSSQETSLSYYVYLKDSNNIVYQFSVIDDVYMAMSRKKGDTITIYSKETLFGNTYYWQGNKLENPLKITE